MRIVYLGTPDFAEKPLEKLIQSGYNVVAVVTQPDKKVGRKQVLTPPPVKVLAEKHNIKVFQYEKIRAEGVADLKSLEPDLMITCAYGQILSQEILDIPKLGTINIHASLLPKYRGSSPIQWSVINGEKETGITVMMTSLGVDEGDIILQEKLSILPDETAGELFDRLAVLGAETIVKAVSLFENNSVVLTPQNHKEATFTKMLSKDIGKIDFNKKKNEIKDFVRGLNPWPVAFTDILGEPIKIYKVLPIETEKQNAGEIISIDSKNGFIISCADGAVKVLELQRQGGKRMSADDFLRGYKKN